MARDPIPEEKDKADPRQQISSMEPPQPHQPWQAGLTKRETKNNASQSPESLDNHKPAKPP
jgi:hypothetical protein